MLVTTDSCQLPRHSSKSGRGSRQPNQHACEATAATASNALGVKKFCYVAYRHMPAEVIRDGVFHICIEGLYESQKKREGLDSENLFIAEQNGKEFRELYQKGFTNIINGQLRD